MNNNLSTLIFNLMQAGLNRQSSVQITADQVGFLKKDFVAFLIEQLNGSFLEHDFSDLTFEVVDEDPYKLAAVGGVFTAGTSQNPLLGIMFSGGIDSSIAPFYAMKDYLLSPARIALLSIDYGQPYREAEDVAQKNIGRWFNNSTGIQHRMYQFQDRSGKPVRLDPKLFPQGYIIPLRNTLVAAVGADTEIPMLWLSANYRAPDSGKKANSGVSDKSEEFFAGLSCVLSDVLERSLRIWSPVTHLSKSQTIEFLYKTVGEETAVKLLRMTVSCYGATLETSACGRCYTCYKNYLNYQRLHIWDSLKDRFSADPTTDPALGTYLEREKNKGRT